MKILSIVLLLGIVQLGIAQGSTAKYDLAISKEFVNRNSLVASHLTPSAKQKIAVTSEAFLKKMAVGKSNTSIQDEATSAGRASFSGQLSMASGEDIASLCFLVLMKASKDMDSDLKEIMDATKAANNEKANLRDNLEKLQKLAGRPMHPKMKDSKMVKTKETKYLHVRIPIIGKPAQLPENVSQLPRLGLAKLVVEEQDELDSLSDLTSEMQTRLQIYMERRSKINETLSNLMKKFSDTSSSLISNLK